MSTRLGRHPAASIHLKGAQQGEGPARPPGNALGKQKTRRRCRAGTNNEEKEGGSRSKSPQRGNSLCGLGKGRPRTQPLGKGAGRAGERQG